MALDRPLEGVLGVFPAGLAGGAARRRGSAGALLAGVGAGDQLVGDLGEPGHGQRLGAEDLVGDHVGQRAGEPLGRVALQQSGGGGQPAAAVALVVVAGAVAERRRPGS